jgi:hypothetical protein
MCHAEFGMFAEGRAFGEEGLQISETMAHPSSLMWASYGFGLLSLCQGDLHEAIPLLERAISICREADLRVFIPRMAAAIGAAYTLAGRVADAVPLLTQAMEQTMAPDRQAFRRCVISRWVQPIYSLAVWRMRTPSPMACWRSPVSTSNGATRRTLAVSSVRSQRIAIPWRARWPQPTPNKPLL